MNGAYRRHLFKRNKNKVYRLIILSMALFITLGYAIVSDSLSINGTTRVTKTTWNVHFVTNSLDDSTSSISNCPNLNSCSAISSRATITDSSTITFSNTLSAVNDYYEFTVDIKNDGTMDAMLYDIVKSGITSSNTDYIDFTVEYASARTNGGTEIRQYDLLEPGASMKIKVKVLKKASPSSNQESTYSLQLNYQQADSNAVKRQDYIDKIKSLNINTEGVNISTTDHENELRFIGSNPNNYVIFNNEASCDSNQENCTDVKWRIIGVIDGKLKLIRESIGGYSWDTSKRDVNLGAGVNQWGASTYTDTTAYGGADLMKLLNPGYENNQDLQCKTSASWDSTNGGSHCGDDSASAFNEDVTVNNSLYWNGESGLCYNYGSYQTTSCNFSSTGLTDITSRNMIDDATWYLGSNSKNTSLWVNDNFNGPDVYTWERQNTNLGKQCSNAGYCSDTVNRTPTWIGKVGLMYPSDYIYATAGGNTYNRDTCLRKSSGYSDGSWQNWSNTYTDCYSNDWLKPSSWYWSLSPRAYSGFSDTLFDVHSSGYVDSHGAGGAGAVRPVVYIKSSVTISGGNGTQSSPYYLQ